LFSLSKIWLEFECVSKIHFPYSWHCWINPKTGIVLRSIWNMLITLIHSLRTSFEYKLILILGFAKFEFWLGKNNIGTLVHVWIIFYFPIGTGPVQLLLIKSLSKTPFLIPVGTRYFPHVLGVNIASIQLESKFGENQDRDQFILKWL
jgi:hypothetical protein